MKKLLFSLIAVLLVMSMVACNGTPDDSDAGQTTSGKTTTTIITSDAETTAPVDEATAMEKIVKKIQEDDNYLIFSVGDSITEGQGASSKATTYTAVFTQGLADRFKDKAVYRIDGSRVGSNISSFAKKIVQKGTGKDGKIAVVRSGYGGNNTQMLIDRKEDFIGKEFEGTTADLFIISIGINDSIVENAKKYVTPAIFKEKLNTLVNLIKQTHPEADIILLTPTWRDYGTEKKSTIDDHAAAMIEFAESKEIPYVDMHKIWMDHLVIGEKNFGQGDWLVDGGDRCHPSDTGHAAMAEYLLKCLFGE